MRFVPASTIAGASLVVAWVAASLAAQAPAPARQPVSPVVARFDAASIKPNTSGDFRRAIGPGPGGRFSALNVPLHDLIAYAYGVPVVRAAMQIVGGPTWMDTARFDVEAVASGGALLPAQAAPMVRALLEERFNLAIHRETREVPVYSLTLDRADGRLGNRLRLSPIDCEARRAARRGAPPPPPADPPQDPATIRPTCAMRQSPGRFAGDAVSMPQLAEALARFAGRIVQDRTGLRGYFDLDLDWLPDQGAVAPDREPGVVPDRDAPGLFTAVREQLGLRLEAARGPLDVVVIDSVDPLLPN
jgi:uncharacterized protein (TIGR03435 family)